MKSNLFNFIIIVFIGLLPFSSLLSFSFPTQGPLTIENGLDWNRQNSTHLFLNVYSELSRICIKSTDCVSSQENLGNILIDIDGKSQVNDFNISSTVKLAFIDSLKTPTERENDKFNFLIYPDNDLFLIKGNVEEGDIVSDTSKIFSFDADADVIDKIFLQNTKDLNKDGITHSTYADIYYFISDKNLKKDIQVLDSGEIKKIIDNINIYSFNYKNINGNFFGVLADEVDKILPASQYSLLKTDKNDYLTINYHSLIAVLSKNQKDQKLNQKLKDAEKLLANLKKKYD